MHILDNKCSAEFKAAIKKNDMKYQLVPPHGHRRNTAEKTIQSFKDHFVVVSCVQVQTSKYSCSAGSYVKPNNSWISYASQGWIQASQVLSPCIGNTTTTWTPLHRWAMLSRLTWCQARRRPGKPTANQDTTWAYCGVTTDATKSGSVTRGACALNKSCFSSTLM